GERQEPQRLQAREQRRGLVARQGAKRQGGLAHGHLGRAIHGPGIGEQRAVERRGGAGDLGGVLRGARKARCQQATSALQPGLAARGRRLGGRRRGEERPQDGLVLGATTLRARHLRAQQGRVGRAQGGAGGRGVA